MAAENVRRRDQGATGTAGLLLIVAGPDGRGKELVVSAARRRFAFHSGIDFPRCVVTRPPRGGAEALSVNRRAFRQMAEEGAFSLSWSALGYEAAAPAEMLRALRAGRLVVLVATREAAEQARAFCRSVHVVEILSGPDATRPPVPLSCARPFAIHRIHHGRDVAEAVRRFTTLIETLLAAGSRSGGGAPRRSAAHTVSHAGPGRAASAVRPLPS